jgi:diguanylate cyclase (GGDEF)-like protein
VEAADVLRASLRQSDIIGRCGGDEFAILVSDALHGSTSIVIDRIQQKVDARNRCRERRYQLSLSIGIVASEDTPPYDLERLMHQADLLMYQHRRDRRPIRRAIEPRATRSSSGSPAPSVRP